MNERVNKMNELQDEQAQILQFAQEYQQGNIVN